MLLDILPHQPWLVRQVLDSGEKCFFFNVVVMVHRLAPALAVCEEVLDRSSAVRRERGGLEVDTVKAANDAIVRKGHLGCGIIGTMRLLWRF